VDESIINNHLKTQYNEQQSDIREDAQPAAIRHARRLQNLFGDFYQGADDPRPVRRPFDMQRVRQLPQPRHKTCHKGGSVPLQRFDRRDGLHFERGMDRNQAEQLASMEFVRQSKDLFITGPTGTGKSYLATALGYKACQEGFRIYYSSTARLMSLLKIAKAKGNIITELKRIERA
jgi:hypothetical protein